MHNIDFHNDIPMKIGNVNKDCDLIFYSIDAYCILQFASEMCSSWHNQLLILWVLKEIHPNIAYIFLFATYIKASINLINVGIIAKRFL